MRTINEIIIHCTATPPSMHVDKATLDRWHGARGFRECGYHYIVHQDGTVERGRALEMQGAHCLGHNPFSVGVVYVGGLSEDMIATDTRTDAQKQALNRLCLLLKLRFPRADIYGHREFATKACPCYDVHTDTRAAVYTSYGHIIFNECLYGDSPAPLWLETLRSFVDDPHLKAVREDFDDLPLLYQQRKL